MNENPPVPERTFRTILTLGVLAAVIRLLLLGGPELLPEEAYYWNYATHLAPGYLDHPPMSAWLIAFGTKIFGLSEFGVRFGSYLCGFVTMLFAYLTAKDVAGKKRALLAAAILSVLPYGMGNFFYISPDAPLAASWAAAIFLIVRIIRSGPSGGGCWGYWLGLGAAFGCGLLSKYSVAILPVAALLLFVMEPSLRRWFFRPQPYVAVVISIILFGPVIYWNATHEWASIVFQGSRRFAEAPRFSLHDFIGHFIVVGTPIGCLVALLCCFGRLSPEIRFRSDPVRFFLMLSFAVPIAIFTVYSVRHLPRLNWSGPPFIGMLPIFALHALGETGNQVRCSALCQRSWKFFLAVSLAGFTFLWAYGGPGVPFLGYTKQMGKMIGWTDLGEKILSAARDEEQAGGAKPFVLGMDKHYTAAELSFYVRMAAERAGVQPPPVGGRAMVGIASLMFQYWLPEEDLTGHPAVLVSRNRPDLEFPEVSQNFTELGPIQEYQATRNGKPVGFYYYRIGRGFKGVHMTLPLREP